MYFQYVIYSNNRWRQRHCQHCLVAGASLFGEQNISRKAENHGNICRLVPQYARNLSFSKSVQMGSSSDFPLTHHQRGFLAQIYRARVRRCHAIARWCPISSSPNLVLVYSNCTLLCRLQAIAHPNAFSWDVFIASRNSARIYRPLASPFNHPVAGAPPVALICSLRPFSTALVRTFIGRLHG